MNNLKRGDGGDPIQEAPVEKRKMWQSEAAFAPLGLWSSSSSRQCCAHRQRQADCLSLSVFSQPLSVIFLFHLLHIPSSLPMVRSRDPPVPTVLTTRLLSRLWYLLTERSTVYFGCTSPATTALITATKLKFFSSTDSHLFVIHSHYHFPKALKRIKKEHRLWVFQIVSTSVKTSSEKKKFTTKSVCRTPGVSRSRAK